MPTQEDNFKLEVGGVNEGGVSRTKWYSLKRAKLPRSIWEWNRNNEEDNEDDSERRIL